MGKPRILVSGLTRPSSGIGVIQRHVYPKLADQFALEELQTRDQTGTGGRITGLIRGFLPGASDADGSVCMVSPLPLRNPKPLVTIVHDLRWREGASALKAAYRKWDLARVVEQSDFVLCVSQTTHEQLIEMFPGAAVKSDWAWLGPGILQEDTYVAGPGKPGQVLLIGGDPRKQNELAGEMLGHLPESFGVTVVGVNLNDAARQACEDSLGTDRCTWLTQPTNDDLIAAFQAAEYYVLLGMGEGFGLPFVEAMGTGTIPVTMDYPLGREIIGDAGVLLQPGAPHELANQLANASKPTMDQLTDRFRMFSWNNFVTKIADALEQSRSER